VGSLGRTPGWCNATGAITAGAAVASNAVRRRALWILVGALVLTAVGGAVVYAATRPDGDGRSATVAQLQDVQRRAEATRIAHRRWFSARKADLLRQIHAAKARNQAAAAPPQPAESGSVPEPQIVRRFIPFGAKRKAETRAYAQRHYGISTDKLVDPKVIVEHYTESADAQSAINTFATDQPDSELHELPQTCAHFVIDSDGTIYQLVSLTEICRHTVGLNYTAFGIEMAGFSDQQILDRKPELDAALTLTRWLRCRYGIDVHNVIGHNESLSSPYHRERVASLRTQTHDDWKHADMNVFRRKLAALGGC
jgi:N-acetylmuramoyl-L-alanine amidase-like protein